MRHRAPDRPLTRAAARVLVVVLAAFALGTGTALAEDLPDPITPPGITPPPDGGDNQVPPGPTYVITPGAGGSELGEPADQAEINEAKKAADTKAPGKGKAPAGTTKKSGSTVAGPGALPLLPGERASDPTAPLDRWWLVGSGAVLLLVVLELGVAASHRLRRQPM